MTELTEFNTGGSHAENPMGGVPQGRNPKGKMNTVEEGETKVDQYVYSDRLKLTATHVKNFKLPTYLTGKSYSEATKLVDKRFEDRKDNASMSTKEAFYSRLEESQEYKKEEIEAREYGISVDELREVKAQEAAEAMAAKKQAQSADNVQGGNQVPPGGEVPQNTTMQPSGGQFGLGGDIGGIVGGLAGMAGTAEADLAKDKEVRDAMSIGGSAAKYGLMGAAAGSVVPGIGNAIGAGVGAATGAGLAMLNNSKIPGEQQTADNRMQGKKLLEAGYNGYTTNAAYGGKQLLASEYRFNPTDEFFLPEVRVDMTRTAEDDAALNAQEALLDKESQAAADLQFETEQKSWDKDSNYSKAIGYGSMAASLAPFVGNMVEGATLEQDDPIKYARSGRTYTPEFADEMRMLNEVDNSFSGIDDQIANAANGNLGAYRAAQLGASVNKAQARFNAYNAINDINRGERKALNADRAAAIKENTQLYNLEQENAAKDKAAYEAAKSAYRTAAYEGLGTLGKEIFKINQGADSTSYSIVDGKKKRVR
jgi:hypothetical protein